MEEFLFKKNEQVLLLGEGNFTFCRELISQMKTELHIHEPGKFTNVYASCFQEERGASIDDEIKAFLMAEGVHLMYGVDATNLANHETIAQKKFERVIFNFPHISGKMRMDLNRALLAKFFVSAASILAYDGNVIVSLCEGQGGTPADKPRRYDDTWKVVENGAAGGLVLVRITRWPASLLSNYRSSGFRGGQKSFRTEGALVHTFKPVEPLDTHSVPDDLMGYCDVPFCKSLRVTLTYQRLLRWDRVSWKNSVQHFVERKIFEHLPKDFANLGELPLTTPNRLDNSQVECLLSGEPAFLRTSFEQVIPAERFRNDLPFYSCGIIFRKTDNDFSSYPGSYKMLIAGCDVVEVMENISTGLKVPLDKRWCQPLRHNVRILDLDLLCLELFKSSLSSTKSLWNPRTRIVTTKQGYHISEVSLYPPTYTFDLSFSSNGPLPDDPFIDLMHNLAGALIESVALQSRYSPEGSYAVYHCFRITYKSYDKPLHRACIVSYQQNAIRCACEKYLDVAVR